MLRDWFGRLAEVRELRDRAVKAEQEAAMWQHRYRMACRSNEQLVGRFRETRERLEAWEFTARLQTHLDDEARRQHPSNGEGETP